MDNLNKDDVNEELENLNPHLVTKKDFNRWRNRAIAAFLILTTGVTLGLYGLQENNKERLESQLSKQQLQIDRNLRDELNVLSTTSCISSRKILMKYNDVLDDLILAANKARQRNIANGDLVRAKDNLHSAKRYAKDKIPVPTKESCAKPILR